MTKANKKQLIELAFMYSRKSGDPHLKVGAILIEKFKYGGVERAYSICAEGHNHLPKSCKDIGYKDENGKTRPEVIHAEAHALSYLMNNDKCSIDNKFELFTTLSPCLECAKLIAMSPVKKVYFYNYYKDIYPLEFLRKQGVKCEQIL
jgi:dCMP deaminase